MSQAVKKSPSGTLGVAKVAEEQWDIVGEPDEDDELEQQPPMLKRLLAADPTRSEADYWVDAEGWDMEKIKSDWDSHQKKRAASRTGVSMSLADAIGSPKAKPEASDPIVLDDDEDSRQAYTESLVAALSNAEGEESNSAEGTMGASLFAEFNADTEELDERAEVVELSDDDDDYAPPTAKAGFPEKASLISTPKANSKGVTWNALGKDKMMPDKTKNATPTISGVKQISQVPKPPAHSPPRALLNQYPQGRVVAGKGIPNPVNAGKGMSTPAKAGKGVTGKPTQKPQVVRGVEKPAGAQWQSKQMLAGKGSSSASSSKTPYPIGKQTWATSNLGKPSTHITGQPAGIKLPSTSSINLPTTSGIKRPFSAVDAGQKNLLDPEGRQYDLTRVVVNLVNVGVTYGKRVEGKDPSRGTAFSWQGVRKCVNYLHDELNMLVIGIIWENFTAPGSAPDEISVPYDIRKKMETTILTPRVTGTHHKSADDEMTIKVAYRRNCKFLDNDNYRDWLVSMKDTKTGIWLQHSQEVLHMRYFFDSGTGDFDTLDGNVAPANRKKSDIQHKFAK